MVDMRMLSEIGVTPAYYKYEKSFKSLKAILPYLFQDLKFVEQPLVLKNVITHIARCIKLGEENFSKAFGGWRPNSDEFGINPLRPRHVGFTTAGTNEWIWTSGAVASDPAPMENWIAAFAMPINRMILAIGYYNLEANPNTFAMQANLGDKRLPVMSIQTNQIKVENYCIMPDFWIILPRSQINVLVSCRNLNTTERMGLLGYVFADDADLITQ